MKEIDISILSREPNKTEEITLIIEPLTPLSMVTDLPGSYYKSQKAPSKKMLCGLIENIIGWRFPGKIRADILNTIKRGKKKLPKYEEGSTYKPLLMDYFDVIGTPVVTFDSLCFYDDLWARNHSRKDSPLEHAIKCRNVSQTLIDSWKCEINADSENKKEINEKYKGQIPNFYPVLPTKREYISMKNGQYRYTLKMDPELLNVLASCIEEYNIGYLGNSEGWVNIVVEK